MAHEADIVGRDLKAAQARRLALQKEIDKPRLLSTEVVPFVRELAEVNAKIDELQTKFDRWVAHFVRCLEAEEEDRHQAALNRRSW